MLRLSKPWFVVALVVATSSAMAQSAPRTSNALKPATKRNMATAVDYAGLIGRSDIVLGRPNLEATQAVTMGNGRLGVAVWSAEGLSAQLNRGDTLPELLAVARVVVPGLAKMTNANDYSGRLAVYDAEFHEHGGGETATTYVDSATDTLVIDVAGAKPDEAQTVRLHLAADTGLQRMPKAEVKETIGILSETWVDDRQPGSSGRNFGSLAAVTAQGREVSAMIFDAETVTLSFRPFADGHFRVLVAAPHFNSQSGPALSVARQSLSGMTARADEPAIELARHRDWWHHFWQRASYMKITSPDGSGEYMENLRTLYLYSAASESGGEYPGSQAGVADLLSSAPRHHWDPAAYWHWNLRMQTAANISSGVPELNAPYFNLYRSDLKSIEEWTQKHMAGRPGICVPETMRFNGPGIEYETWDTDGPPIIGLNCAADSKPYYNARTISTGAEVTHWIWQQYLATNDRKFLAANLPVMVAASRFMMSYETNKADGLLHTNPSNAHETQWDVEDPTTDLEARTVLYADTLHAAQILGVEAELAQKLKVELDKIPPFPRTEAGESKSLLSANDDARESDVIGNSYQPASENHNVENIGLDPVWPFDLIGDISPMFALAKRTYEHRPNPTNQDWSFDPIQAARLGLRDDVRSTMIKLTQTYQTFVNGYANWGGTSGEFYIEQQGVVADALNEALVQDYDGLIRINPAFPKDWDVQGQVAVRGKTRIDVNITGGAVKEVVIEAGSSGKLKIRNPWGESEVEVIAAGHPSTTLSGGTLELTASAGESYRLHRKGETASSFENLKVSGTPAIAARKLGPAQIGIFAEAQ